MHKALILLILFASVAAADQNPELQANPVQHYIKQAEYYMVLMDCENASRYANLAKEYLLKKYKEFRDSPHGRMKEEEYYQNQLRETEELIKYINSICYEKDMLSLADKLYKNASIKYLDKDYSASLVELDKAKALYAQSRNYVGLSKTQTLQKMIKDAKNQTKTTNPMTSTTAKIDTERLQKQENKNQFITQITLAFVIFLFGLIAIKTLKKK